MGFSGIRAVVLGVVLVVLVIGVSKFDLPGGWSRSASSWLTALLKGWKKQASA